MSNVRNTNLIEKIDEYANNKHYAIVCGDNKHTYSDMKKITDSYALLLIEKMNHKRQEPVIIYMKRGISFVEWMISCLKAGLYYVPIEESVPIDRVAYVARDIQATIVIGDSNTFKRLQGLGENSLIILNSDDYEGNMKIGSIESDGRDFVPSEGNELAYVMYTSGTSGYPKGVKIMMKNLQNLVEAFEEIVYHKYKTSINVGVVASFSFDSSVKQIYSALYYGHCLCIAAEGVKYFGQKIIGYFKAYDISVSDLTPSHLKLLVMQKKYDDCHASTLVVGGEKLRYEVLNKLNERFVKMPQIINVYGPTECCVDVTYHEVVQNDMIKNKKGDVPVGKALKNTRIILRDENKRIIDESMVMGELCIVGKQVGAGYVNITSDAFYIGDYGPEYNSKDLAYVDRNEEIVVIGRTDKQIKINGNRVETEEISFVIRDYLQCECFVMLAHKNERDLLVAFLLRREMTKEQIKDLNEYLKRKLVAYMIPTLYICDEKLPLTINGKIDEREILKNVEKLTSKSQG